MPIARRAPTTLILAIALVTPSTSSGQWPTDPSANLPIAVDPLANKAPLAISDAQGGAIVAWEFIGPSTLGRDIRVQRIDASGNTLWLAAGVPVSSAAGDQMGISIVPDGSGGVVLAWQDWNGSGADIYAQRVDSNGNAMWAANGVPICTAVGDQIDVQLAANGQGDAVAVWRDKRVDGVNADVFAQHISPGGAILWALNGNPVCLQSADQARLAVVSSSEGATVVVWEDERNGLTSEDIYAQRLMSSGAAAWTTDGISVCSATDRQLTPQLISTPDGGVIVVWGDYRTVSTGSDIYAQRLDLFGAPVWTAGGAPICTASGAQLRPQLTADGASGAIVCWPDARDGSSIYASRLMANGQLPWATDGVAVCAADRESEAPKIITDANGGAIIAWEDTRNVPFPSFHTDVYAQRLSSNGSPVWTLNGVAVSTAVDGQHSLSAVSDLSGGLVVVWEDWRDGGSGAERDEVYAQRVNADGSLGGPTSVPTSPSLGLRMVAATPNPFSSSTTIEFESGYSGAVGIALYTVSGGLVFRDEIEAARGINTYVVNGDMSNGRRLSSGVYFLRLQSRYASAISKLVVTR